MDCPLPSCLGVVGILMPDNPARFGFIQRWRGIAVILVVYYHFSNRVPPEYLDMAEPPTIVFHFGKLGVLIFFVISGYLITKSLKSSRNLAEFYAKRISRIWPLFVLASAIIFVFLQFVEPPIVPDGPNQFFSEKRDWTDLIGSIFFLEDFGFRWMDGVFWSILVELKFYFWIGLLSYFRPKTFIHDFATVSVIMSVAELILRDLGPPRLMWISTGLNGFFVAQYLPYFAIGALLTISKYRGLLAALSIIAVTQLGLKFGASEECDVAASAMFLGILFILLLVDFRIFQSRIIRHVGDHSYGFYLFHQMIGLSIIKMLGGLTSHDLAIAVALIVTYLAAYWASRLAEWRFRTFTHVLLMNVFAKIRLHRLRFTRSPSGPPQ